MTRVVAQEQSAEDLGSCRAEVRGGQRCVVKRSLDRAGRRSLERERAVYRTLTGRSVAVRSLTAPLLDGDVDELVLGRVPGVHLREAHERRVAPGATLAVAVAEAVARVHELEPLEGLPFTRACPHRPVHRPTPQFVATLSAGQVALVRMIQRSAELCASLDRIVPGPPTHFIHGDLRWQNVVVHQDVAAGWTVRLVDWEYAGVGDPLWDLGCFVADALCAWVDDMPRLDPRHAEAALSRPTVPFHRPNAWIGPLLDTYLALRPDAAASDQDGVRRTFTNAAVRLAHRAFEGCAATTSVSMGSVVLLQLATNILADPLAAGLAFGTGLGASAPEGQG